MCSGNFFERIKLQATKRITLDFKWECKLFRSLIRTIKSRKKGCHQIITVTIVVVSNLPHRQGRLKCVSVPMEICFSWNTARGRRSKNLYTKSKTLTLTCSLIWACSETVNLHDGKIMKVENRCNIVRTRQFVPASPHHFLSSALPVWHEVAWFRIYSYQKPIPRVLPVFFYLCVQFFYTWITVSSPS
jgi:hypothetical protein